MRMELELPDLCCASTSLRSAFASSSADSRERLELGLGSAYLSYAEVLPWHVANRLLSR
jgi:hypothetical protein